MINRIALLSSALCVLAVCPSQAQKLSLPVGEWGHSSDHGLDCSPPFLKIEPNRIVKRLSGSEGRCPIKKIRKDGRYLIIDVKCVYDKIMPSDFMIHGDDDDDSFSLIIQSPKRILFNNTPHELCKSAPGGGQ